MNRAQTLRAQVSRQGKTAFTFVVARKAAKALRNADKGRPEPYRCQFCGWWHIGNSTGHMPDRRREILGKNNDEERS